MRASIPLDALAVLTAIQQLEKSERGQMTCKLLRDFLHSPTVKFIDEPNQNAVAVLVARYMLGSSKDACTVMDALNDVVERNKWTEGK